MLALSRAPGHAQKSFPVIARPRAADALRRSPLSPSPNDLSISHLMIGAATEASQRLGWSLRARCAVPRRARICERGVREGRGRGAPRDRRSHTIAAYTMHAQVVLSVPQKAERGRAAVAAAESDLAIDRDRAEELRSGTESMVVGTVLHSVLEAEASRVVSEWAPREARQRAHACTLMVALREAEAEAETAAHHARALDASLRAENIRWHRHER